MSAALLNVVYGVPITDDFNETFKEYLDGENPEQEDYEEYGFSVLYSAGGFGRPIGYLGEKLEKFSEGCDFPASDLSDFEAKITDKVMKKVQKKLDDLPTPSLRAAAGKPKIWFVWSNS